MEGIAAAAEAAQAGKLVVIPTDTVYGLGTRPDRPEATARVFQAKRRPPQMELPVLVASVGSVEAIAETDERARRLMHAFWPGPLTLVLARAAGSGGWELGGDPATVGVRMPDHPLALAVLQRSGPLAVTSANLSGDATPATCDEVVAIFGETVAVYVCDERPLEGRPSTVLDLAREEPRILREGSLPAAEVLAAVSA